MLPATEIEVILPATEIATEIPNSGVEVFDPNLPINEPVRMSKNNLLHLRLGSHSQTWRLS